MSREVIIKTEYIKLQDVLKFSGLAESGGDAKTAVQTGEVSVNGAVCTERGRKIRPGDTVVFRSETLSVAYGT